MKRKNERIITYQKIEEYGQWLERCERSRETIKKYRHYLKQFKEFSGDEPVNKEMESGPAGAHDSGHHQLRYSRAQRVFQILWMGWL